MTWTTTLQPTELSRAYLIKVYYTPGWFPQVKVLPKLPSRPGEALPHTYRNGSLCLHKADEWSPDMLIADTIVPWTCEWLIHYEIWLATGEWYGGGEELVGGEQPDSASGSRRERRARRRRLSV